MKRKHFKTVNGAIVKSYHPLVDWAEDISDKITEEEGGESGR